MRWLAGLLPALLLAGCASEPEPQPASPALWRIEGPRGETGWLFGTIHALERPALWRSPKVAAALKQADPIVVEVAGLADQSATQVAFAELSQSPGLPPVSARTDPALRANLDAAMAKLGVSEARLSRLETWAVALLLARSGQEEGASANGIDRAILTAAEKRRVVELEGIAGQFALFDALPEAEQRDLLDAVLRNAGAMATESEDLAEAWRKGDMARIEAETNKGLLADPELREALFAARNRAWTQRIGAMLAKGQRPFVAVGAAHMAGPDGLVALLASKGYRVTRAQ